MRLRTALLIILASGLLVGVGSKGVAQPAWLKEKFKFRTDLPERFGKKEELVEGNTPPFATRKDSRLDQINRIKSLSGQVLGVQSKRAADMSKEAEKGERFGADIVFVNTFKKGKYSLELISAHAAFKNRLLVKKSGGVIAEIYNKDGANAASFTLGDDETDLEISFESYQEGNWKRVFALISGNNKAMLFAVEDQSDFDWNDLIAGIRKLD